MTAHQALIIDGKEAASRLREAIATEVATMAQKPGLAVILVGDDPASQVYVRNKIRACEATSIQSFEHRLPADTTQDALHALIATLNADRAVHGILPQLPLPPQIDEQSVIQAIDPGKDVDGLHPLNLGRLMSGLPGLVPCTPQGSMHLIKEVQADLTGLHAVVIGRSILFGKPMAQLLLEANCTVTHCHSRTRDLASHCAQADILVAAVGRAHLVQGDWVKKGAIVIDVGINRLDNGTMTGDVDFDAACAHARAITPVPGGVGPMTIAYLLKNTLQAAKST